MNTEIIVNTVDKTNKASFYVTQILKFICVYTFISFEFYNLFTLMYLFYPIGYVLVCKYYDNVYSLSDRANISNDFINMIVCAYLFLMGMSMEFTFYFMIDIMYITLGSFINNYVMLNPYVKYIDNKMNVLIYKIKSIKRE